MAAYIGILHKEPGSDYGVSFPDFPGCITTGATMREAVTAASEALGAHIRFLRREGDPVPEPSELDTIMKNPDFADGMPFVTHPSLQLKGKAVRVNVTIDEYLLAEIDERAEKLGVTRAAFLAEAARRALI